MRMKTKCDLAGHVKWCQLFGGYPIVKYYENLIEYMMNSYLSKNT